MTRLPGTAALLALTLLAILTGCGSSTPKNCPSGQTPCGGSCIDPAAFQTDPAHCGGCGIACGHGTCAGGLCQCEGWTSCSGQNPRCADTQNDLANCGGCGIACGHGSCSGGACQCADWTFCSGQNPRCADTQNDPASCGDCGRACTEPGAGCALGTCGCYPPRPDDCTTLCTDWRFDPQNCGTTTAACGHACPLTNDECVEGSCQCPTSLPTPCPTVGPTHCVNLGSDEQNCGACGNVCAAGATCTSESCHCPAGEVVCGSSCVNTQTDAQHCGGCATACPSSATCSSGTCRCPAGPQAGCGETCCAGGDACCGLACATQHANGLGQFYYDCGSLDEHTFNQAHLAAVAWSPTGLPFESGGLQCPSCLCRQSATAAAIWCYADSPMKGFVKVTASPNCLAAACPFGDGAQAWH